MARCPVADMVGRSQPAGGRAGRGVALADSVEAKFLGQHFPEIPGPHRTMDAAKGQGTLGDMSSSGDE